MVVGAMANIASTPQASCGHIGIVRSILSASPCAVPTSSHMDWCLSELRIRIFSDFADDTQMCFTYRLHVGDELARPSSPRSYPSDLTRVRASYFPEGSLLNVTFCPTPTCTTPTLLAVLAPGPGARLPSVQKAPI